MSLRKMRPACKAGATIAISLAVFFASVKVTGDGMYRISGHVPDKQLLRARYLGHRIQTENMKLALVLRPRDPGGLEEFLKKLHDPTDPEYRRFITPEEYAERFGPSEDDIRLVSDHLARNGLRVKDVHQSRLVLEVEGPVASVERAFILQINNYSLQSGRLIHSADADPIFPAAVAGKEIGRAHV